MKKIAIIIGIILAGVALFRGYQVIKSRQVQKSDEIRKIPVLVEPVALGDIRNIISFSGDIKADEEVEVFPKVNGKLAENRVKEGDQVKKDQVLALVDRDLTGMKYELSEVTSPLSGIVAKVYNDPGAGLSPPSMSISMGTPIARVVNMDVVKVNIDIPEYRLSAVKKNQIAGIRVDAFPDRDFLGRISEITPVVDPLTRTSRAEIAVPNPEHRLRPGMFARVSLITAEKKKAVKIPIRSLLKIEDRDCVFTVANEKAVKRELELGIREGETVEVLSGLSPGENLVVVGQEMLTDGIAVEVVQE